MDEQQDILSVGFALKSREEVVRFEELCDIYANKKILFPIKHISLVGAYDYSKKLEYGEKLFSAVLDIHINYLLLWGDQVSISKSWADESGQVITLSGTILDCEANFFHRMDLHRQYNSFIFRYRALWDKLMGCTILIIVPAEYEQFIKARSRRKTFRKILTSLQNQAANDLLLRLDACLDAFDNKFRTPEAHGTGALRKSSLVMSSMDDSPIMVFNWYWTEMLYYVVFFGKLLKSE